MPPAAVPERTPCSTVAEWNQHVKDAMLVIDQTETEENWDRMERAYLVLASVVRGGAYKLEADFVPGVRTISRQTTAAMLSDRSRLSGTAVELLTVIGARMGAKFEPLIQLYIPAVLKLCTRSGKIYVSRATNCLKLFAAYCRVPTLVNLLKESMTDKSLTLRFAITDALHDLLSTSVRDGLPKRTAKLMEDVEAVIKLSARDSNPETRKMSRRVFMSYSQLFPERVADFTRPLSPVTRKYLDIDDSVKAESSKRPQPSSHASAPNTGRRTPTLERQKSTATLVARTVTTSHSRTASEQEVFPAAAPAPRIRSVRSMHFRSNTQPHVTTAAARPPSRERPPSRTQRPESREQEHSPPATIEPITFAGASSSRTATADAPAPSRRLQHAPHPLVSKDPFETQQAPAKLKPMLVTAPLPSSATITFNTVLRAPPPAPASAPGRQYPVTSSGFVPTSKRYREAEAEYIPLPPSPKATPIIFSEVPAPIALPPPVPEAQHRPPSVASVQSDAEKQSLPLPSSASTASVGERTRAVPSIISKIQPSFRPRRGGAVAAVPSGAGAPPGAAPQPRKVSNFGAPSIVTKVIALPPHAPTVPVVSASASTSAPSKDITTSNAGTSRTTKPSIPSQGRPAPSTRPASAHAVPSATSSRHGEATATSRKASASTSSSVPKTQRSVTTPAISTSSKPSTIPTSSSAAAVSSIDTTEPTKREPRSRNATGMTTSQMMKQKPPVQRTIRSVKSVANLAGRNVPPVPKVPAKTATKKKAVEPEVAAVVPLPPSPKLAAKPAEVPLPPSPGHAAAAASTEHLDVVPELAPLPPPAPVRTLRTQPSFPTIESIKESLSDVPGPEPADIALPPPSTNETSLLLSASSGMPPVQSSPPKSQLIQQEVQEEPEFTLSDLDIPPPRIRMPVSSRQIASSDASPEQADYDDFEAIEVLDQQMINPRDDQPMMMGGDGDDEDQPMLVEAIQTLLSTPPFCGNERVLGDSLNMSTGANIVEGEKEGLVGRGGNGRVALGDVGVNVFDV